MRSVPTSDEVMGLISSPNWEKRRLDFKSGDCLAIPGSMPSEVVELKDWEISRDVASFANTPGGGDIIIGVEDERKHRKVSGFVITDAAKTRLANILRTRINPPAELEVDVVEIDGQPITILTIFEGRGDLCTVIGTVHVRDLNGRTVATGHEITQLVIRRLERAFEQSSANSGDLERRNRDDVIRAMYEIGDGGMRGVTPEELEAAGFPKLQIHNAIRSAKQEGWIIDASSHDGTQWLLNREARYYVEALREERGRAN